jgi:hypothetical protein
MLRKAPKRDLYWVINKQTKQKHSKEPLPKERAQAQMRALYAQEDKRGAGRMDRMMAAAKRMGSKVKEAVSIPAELNRTWDYFDETRDAAIEKYPDAAEEIDRIWNAYSDEVAFAHPSEYPSLIEGFESKMMRAVQPFIRTTTRAADRLAFASPMARAKQTAQKAAIPQERGARVQMMGGPAPKPKAAAAAAEGDAAGAVAPPPRFVPPPPPPRPAVRDEGRAILGADDRYAYGPTRPRTGRGLYDLLEGAGFADEFLKPFKTLFEVGKLVGKVYKAAYKAKKGGGKGKADHGLMGLLEGAGFADEFLKPFRTLFEVGKLVGKVYKAAATAKPKKGSGIFGDIYKKVKTTVSGAVNLANRGIRKGYSPSAKRMLDQYGDAPIVELAVRRDPIQSFINIALNAITLGKWGQAKRDLHYDKLFHLGLVVGVKKNGRRTNLIVEKNEVINIAVAKRPDSDTEFYHVPLRGKQLTFGQLMENAERAKGMEFFLYDAFENNCQDFVLGLLKESGLLDENGATFIKQPIDQLMRKLPSFTQTVARKITDLGAAANVVLEGEGAKKKGGQVGHAFKTRFEPKTGFFHRPFEPMSGAGSFFFLKGSGSTYGRYYIDPKLTIPDLANFLNEMTAPNEIAGVLAKLESPTESNYQGERGRTYYNFYRDNREAAFRTADGLEQLLKEQYDQSMELLNAMRSGKTEGLGQLVNAVGQGISVFRTIKSLNNPVGILKFGAESLMSLINAIGSGSFYEVAPQVSYSYSAQLESELARTFGPAGQLGAQIAGTLGELFGAKTQAERNDPYVESVIRAKRDEGLTLLREFKQRWEDNLRNTKAQEERMDVEEAENRKGIDQHVQYEREVFWMDRLTPEQWQDRFNEARPADRPYVSFESWKAKKGYGRGPVAGGGTHREDVLKRYDLPDKSYSLAKLAKVSGIPKAILQEVYNRGIGAYKTQPSSVRLKGSFVKNVAAPMSKKLSKEQWAYARVYSFIDGNPKHDNDLRRNEAKVGSGKAVVFRSLEKSNKAGKKWRVNLTVNGRSRTIHFGAAGMDDFTKTKDEAQKARYIDRHEKREDWTAKGVPTAGFWSRWILWNKPTVAASLSDVRKRFSL